MYRREWLAQLGPPRMSVAGFCMASSGLLDTIQTHRVARTRAGRVFLARFSRFAVPMTVGRVYGFTEESC